MFFAYAHFCIQICYKTTKWANLDQLGSNLGLTWANLEPSWPQLGPSWSQPDPKWPPQIHPRASQDAPRGFQEPPKTLQEAFKSLQNTSKKGSLSQLASKRGSRKLQEGPKAWKRRSQTYFLTILHGFVFYLLIFNVLNPASDKSKRMSNSNLKPT